MAQLGRLIQKLRDDPPVYAPPPYRVIVEEDEEDEEDDPSPSVYFLTLILGPILVGLPVLAMTLLAGGDYMKWAVVSSVATFAIVLVWGVSMVWEIIVGWVIIVGIGWWLLHLLGIVPGLPW